MIYEVLYDDADAPSVVEAFGGAASVLVRKPRSYAEVYNDLDGDVVTLFRVLRDPEQSARLVAALRLTPFARDEYELAYEDAADDVERSRRLVARSFMGHGSDAPANRSGFRANSNKSGSTPAHDWANLPQALAAVAERLTGVVVEHRDAMDVCRQHDAPDTLHYLDPPYLPDTRSTNGRRHNYRFELTAGQHAALLGDARALTGMVVISGYPAAVYDNALAGWARHERTALADGARPRTEVLWINQAATAALDSQQPMLFAG